MWEAVTTVEEKKKTPRKNVKMRKGSERLFEAEARARGRTCNPALTESLTQKRSQRLVLYIILKIPCILSWRDDNSILAGTFPVRGN